jgi:polyphosphate kinase
MFVHTDISEAPWYVLDADIKRKTRLNCISHLLSRIPYEPPALPEIAMPDRQRDDGYVRPPRELYSHRTIRPDTAGAWARLDERPFEE